MCYGTILEASMRKARKMHKCAGCCKEIEPGRAYFRQVLVDGGSFEPTAWCLLCHAKYQVLADASGDSCVGDVDDAIDEGRRDDPSGFRKTLRDAMRNALARLKGKR